MEKQFILYCKKQNEINCLSKNPIFDKARAKKQIKKLWKK
jgi:hypothetical protein